MYRIGIDLGGTNIAAGLVRDLEILDRVSVKTNIPRPMEGIIDDMVMLVHTLVQRNDLSLTDIRSVGVGVPCTANEENGHMEDANNLGFDDEPFLKPLGEKLGLPVCFGNDANVAAWGEYRTGGYEASSFLMVTIGTGIGGGIILDGKLWPGYNFASGEFGHMTIPGDGALCTCGRRNCFEACASATALIRQAREAMERSPNTVLHQCTEVEAKSVFDGAAAGDDLCIRLLDAYTTYLAEGIANIINIFQPAYLCIGGGVSKAGPILLDPLKAKTAERVYSQNAKRNTRIVLAKLDNDAGILGAALLEKKEEA